MKRIILVLLTLVVSVSFSLADCPENTYDCIIDGKAACCPKTENSGIRGDFSDVEGLLAVCINGNNRCRAACKKENVECENKCLGLPGPKPGERGYGFSAQEKCESNCEEMYDACTCACN